MAFYFYFLTH